eukprot:superscaffoldBa00000320_g3775
MLLKQQDQVPDHLTVRQMKTWLLTGRNFVEDKEILSLSNGAGGAGRGEAAFTAAEQEGDAKPGELLELQQSTAPVIQEMINTTLKFLLEEPESADQIEAASVEVGRLLSDSAAPCLPQYGPLSAAPLLAVCTIAARFMVKSILKDFDHHSKTFHIMDYDDSLFSARENVIFAIQDMDNRVQTAACRPQPQLSTSEGSQEGLLEKEASPEVLLDETTTVRTSMLRLEANVIVCMEPELDQKEGFLEEREASPQVSLDDVTTTSSRLETNFNSKRLYRHGKQMFTMPKQV